MKICLKYAMHINVDSDKAATSMVSSDVSLAPFLSPTWASLLISSRLEYVAML